MSLDVFSPVNRKEQFNILFKQQNYYLFHDGIIRHPVLISTLITLEVLKLFSSHLIYLLRVASDAHDDR